MPPRPKKRNEHNLTPKEQKLVEGVLSGKSQTRAAVEAGYNQNSACGTASDILNKPEVQRYYQQRVRALIADPEEITATLAVHMRADFADFEGCIDDNGRLDWKLLRERGVSRLVKKIKVKARLIPSGVPNAPPIPEIETEIELHSAQQAAIALAKIHGLEKRPAMNPEDLQWAKDELKRLREKGYSDEESVRILVEAEPQARHWIN